MFNAIIWPLGRLAVFTALVRGIFLWLEQSHPIYVDRWIATMIGVAESVAVRVPSWVGWTLSGTPNGGQADAAYQSRSIKWKGRVMDTPLDATDVGAVQAGSKTRFSWDQPSPCKRADHGLHSVQVIVVQIG